jgi:hypothetical protein
LLGQHGVKDGGKPILKLAIVVVGNDEVSDPIHSALAQIGAVEIEISQVGFSETFNKILLDSTGGRDEGRHMLVFD